MKYLFNFVFDITFLIFVAYSPSPTAKIIAIIVTVVNLMLLQMYRWEEDLIRSHYGDR